MTAQLTRRQQQIAHRYGLCCMIGGRCEHGTVAHYKASLRGATGFKVGGIDYWMDTTTKGIQIRSPHNAEIVLTHNGRQFHYKDAPDDLVTWAALTRHIDALPTPLRHQAARVDRLAHRVFPDREWQPGKRPRKWTQAEQEWSHERHWRIVRMKQAVYDAAFPLAITDEPTDLLELIGATS